MRVNVSSGSTNQAKEHVKGRPSCRDNGVAPSLQILTVITVITGSRMTGVRLGSVLWGVDCFHYDPVFLLYPGLRPVSVVTPLAGLELYPEAGLGIGPALW